MAHHHDPKQAQWLVDNAALLWQSYAWVRSAITSYKSCSKHTHITKRTKHTLQNSVGTGFKNNLPAHKHPQSSQITTQLYNSYK